MKTELRFLLAIILMVGVMVVTNLLFPPIAPEAPDVAAGDTAGAVPGAPRAATAPPAGTPAADPSAADAPAADTPAPGPTLGIVQAPDSLLDTTPVVDPEREIVVESPLYRHVFSTRGARLISAELPAHRSFTRAGPVQLIADGAGALGIEVVVGSDTVDLRDAHFTPSRDRVDVAGGPQELAFRHDGPGYAVELVYRFTPDSYVIEVSGSLQGLERALVVTDLGPGLPLNDADPDAERRALAYVGNHLREGIDSYPLRNADERVVHEGPYLWAAFKSKFFVLAMLPGRAGAAEQYFGGITVEPESEEHAEVAVTSPSGADGSFAYRAYVGPQDYAQLSALGSDMDEVNPFGWRIFRPMVRPFVGLISTTLTFLHDSLNLSYGWVLVVFGVLVRLLLWPLNQKAMRAQMKNMAVQPLLKEIQVKYKDNPEKLQKEMMKLYQEHGFNPFAGCLPMLIPMPILFALFFVFGGSIEFRGASFLWLPDLSAPDPFFILPVFLGISMFLLQWIGMRSMPEVNPQMKMMMWMMPIMMVVIFFKLAAGLNLYYSVSNLVTIPQQHWLAKERAKAQAKLPAKGPAKKT